MAAKGPGPPPRQEPIFNISPVVVAVAVLLIGVHAALNWASPATQDLAIRNLAFVPGRLTVWLWPARAIELLVRANHDPSALEQALAMREIHALSDGPKLWTLLTYALLHGSWTHVLLNTIWLVAFGPPVARRFGSVGFVLFMAAAAVAGALAHWASATLDFSPLIGASAAVSGLMGAAARFMFQPGAPLGAWSFKGRMEVEAIRPAPLMQVFVEPRARIFLIVWLATNFIFGAFARQLGLSDMPVAWIAHLGGFAAGLVLFPLFDSGRAPRLPPTDIADR